MINNLKKMIGSRKSSKKCSRGRVGVKSHKRSSGKTVKSHCRRLVSRKSSKKASKKSSKKVRRSPRKSSHRKTTLKAKFMGFDGLRRKAYAFEYLPDPTM